MKNREHFRLTHAKALKNSRLKLSYADGLDFNVDLSDWIGTSDFLKPLQSHSVFSTVKLSAYGRAVEFGKGEIDLAADNLRNLAVEQSGG